MLLRLNFDYCKKKLMPYSTYEVSIGYITKKRGLRIESKYYSINLITLQMSKECPLPSSSSPSSSSLLKPLEQAVADKTYYPHS
jgi:hypothetical protein